METICSHGYYRNCFSCFVATHALRHMIYVHHVHKWMNYHKVIVLITGGPHCFHDCIYIRVHGLIARSKRLSYQTMSSIRTQSQLCTATPISSLCPVFKISFRPLPSSVATFALSEISHM